MSILRIGTNLERALSRKEAHMRLKTSNSSSSSLLFLPQVDNRPVTDLAEGDHLEGHGEGLVAPPVAGQGGAQKVGRPGLDQLAGVLGQYVVDLSLGPPPLGRVHGARLLLGPRLGGGARPRRPAARRRPRPRAAAG